MASIESTGEGDRHVFGKAGCGVLIGEHRGTGLTCSLLDGSCGDRVGDTAHHYLQRHVPGRSVGKDDAVFLPDPGASLNHWLKRVANHVVRIIDCHVFGAEVERNVDDTRNIEIEGIC